MPLPLALYLQNEFCLVDALCWAVLFSPSGLFGVYGVVQAFGRRRYRAVKAGLWSALPATWYYVALWVELLTASREQPIPGLPLMFLPGVFPLVAGFWAVLLAYLIPPNPQPPPPWDGRVK